MNNNIANVPNADDDFIKALTLDIDEAVEKNEKLRKEISDEDINSEEMFQFIFKKGKSLIESSEEVMERMGGILQTLPDPEFAKSYASIVQSTAGLMRNLVDVAASKNKEQTMIKVKEMDIEAKKELKQMDASIAEIEGPKTVNVLMTRGEIFERLFKEKQQEENLIENKKEIEKKDKVVDI